jgi:assimilatory nitrate reductase catalytic subunit
VLLRAAHREARDAGFVDALLHALHLGSGRTLRYADPRRGQWRALQLADDGTLQGFVLAGDASAEAWVLALLQQRQPAAVFGQALLAGSREPPGPVAPRSPQVCACHDVSEARITEVLACRGGADGDRLLHLQQQLRCGTQCGSCVPALQALVRRVPAAVPQAA